MKNFGVSTHNRTSYDQQARDARNEFLLGMLSNAVGALKKAFTQGRVAVEKRGNPSLPLHACQ